MSQDFRLHPINVNYEASSDGVVRNCRLKKPVGFVDNHGYLRFGAGGKNYYIHRIIYEAFNGLIKDGFVIDHIDSNPHNNNLSNLQAISQSDNTRKERQGLVGQLERGQYIHLIQRRMKKCFFFQSMNAAGKHFGICPPSIRKVAENITKYAVSKKNGHRTKFSYS